MPKKRKPASRNPARRKAPQGKAPKAPKRLARTANVPATRIPRSALRSVSLPAVATLTPAGAPDLFSWDTNFQAASSANDGRYVLSASGEILEKATGKPARRIWGVPFPSVTAADTQAGEAILWNRWFTQARGGNETLPFDIDIAKVSTPDSEIEGLTALYFAYHADGTPHALGDYPLDTIFRDAIVTPGPRILHWRYAAIEAEDVWLGMPPQFDAQKVGAAFRQRLVSPTSLTPEDLFVWTGELRHFQWSVLEQELEIVATRQPVRLIEGEEWNGNRREWIAAPQFHPSGDPWRSSSSNHEKVRRGIYKLVGTPQVGGYGYTSHELYVDRRTFFLYLRTLQKEGTVFRTVRADYAPAWSDDGSFRLPFSTVQKAEDSQIITYVRSGAGPKLCRFNSPKFPPGKLSPQNLRFLRA